MSSQSWVETTLPPGYVGELPDPCKGEDTWSFFFTTTHDNVALFCCRRGFASEYERNRAAWRHWTAAVLRGRGDVRADDYGESGGVVWHVAHAGGRDWPSCWTLVTIMTTIVAGGGFGLCPIDPDFGEVMLRYADDIDEAMARFAWLVGFAEGPASQKTSRPDRGSNEHDRHSEQH